MLLGKCNIMLSDTPSSDTYLHFLRENGDKAHISRFTLISQSEGIFCFFHSSKISEFITKLISGDVFRRPEQGENSDPMMLTMKKEKKPSPPYSEAEL